MTDLQSLQQLRERLSKLEGPDRGVDGFIARDLLGWIPNFNLEGDELVHWPDVGGHWNDQHEDSSFDEPPEWTASIDAALALVERVLPGQRWTLGYWNDGVTCSFLSQDEYGVYWEGADDPRGNAKTAPLAILLALLDALISQQEDQS